VPSAISQVGPETNASVSARGATVGTKLLKRPRSVRSALYGFYFKAERRIVPQLRSSQYAYYDALRAVIAPGCRWLDLGCGHQVLAEWMLTEEQSLVRESGFVAGMDLDWQALLKHRSLDKRVFGNLTAMPFRSAAWDLVSANMVMEHLQDPAPVLREVHRLLAPNGTFVFHTPNYYHWVTLAAWWTPEALKKPLVKFLEGRSGSDVFQTHYQINTNAAVRRLAAENDFDVVDLRLVNTSAALKMLGPAVVAELLYIRLLERPEFAQLRSNLVVTLRKRSRS
jgi:SAM-dependent methyltransferase